MASRILFLGVLACSIALGDGAAQGQSRRAQSAPPKRSPDAQRPSSRRTVSQSNSASQGNQGRLVSQVGSPFGEPVMGEPTVEAPYVPIEPEQMMGQEPLDVPQTSIWSKVPNARIFPRPGNFFILPSGPGYYSLMDQVRGNRREGPQQSGYPAFAIMAPGFFDADFRYLDEKPRSEQLLYERLKRLHIGKNFLFSTGGETWYRYNNEINSRLTQTNNQYGLTKVRLYGDLWYRDKLRVYTEFIDADRGGGSLPPLPVDIDRADLLDCFVDYKLGEIKEHPVYVRAGRQEVLLGSQRLISTLPWANMRRNFDGVRGFRQGEKFDVDLFWLQPVIPNKNQFDSSDHNQTFSGAWFTYRPKKGHFLDFYYLYYNNSNTIVQQGIAIAPERFNTLGTRYAGDKNDFLWDFETAMQLGRRGSEKLVAGMATTGIGYHWSKRRLNPTLWLYYDFASGDANPNAGNFTTFNQLFPFGHYYLGWTDAAGRQNIQDVNLHLGIYPTKWITVWGQYHHFWLNQPKDALYNAGGVAIRRDPSGAAGTNVGDEIDLVMNFHLNVQSDLMVVYGQLFGGNFLKATSSPTAAASSEVVYLMYNYRW